VFRVKICGLRDLEELNAVLASEADAIGLNFYSRSKRHVSIEAAQVLSEAAEGKCLRVGLFVNSPVESVEEVCRQVPVDVIQAHGDENAAWFRQARKLQKLLLRAVRSPQSAADLLKVIESIPPNGGLYDALLIDGLALGSSGSGPIYGGSGTTANWRAIREIRDSITVPLILAGGLTPENVAEAIAIVRPDGVDVAGGVENLSGGKDANKVAAFARAARQALSTH
jgi:phosphoribosylanthranilate isomerase